MSRRPQIALLVFFDALAAAGAYLFFYVVRFEWGLMGAPTARPSALLLPLSVISLFWVLLFAGFGLYSRAATATLVRQVVRVAKASIVGILFLFFVFFINTLEPGAAQSMILVYWACVFAFVTAGRLVAYRIQGALLAAGVGAEPLLLVGWSDKVDLVLKELERNRHLGYAAVAIVRFIEAKAPDEEPDALEATVTITSRRAGAAELETQYAFTTEVDELLAVVPRLIDRFSIQGMLIALGPGDLRYYLELIKICSAKAVPARFISNYYPIAGALPEENFIRGLSLPRAALAGAATDGAEQQA